MGICGADLKGVHGLEFAEGLDGGDVFLLRASPDTGLALLWFLSLHQRFLLWGFHAPGHHRGIDRRRAVHLLVLGGSHIGGLDCEDHGIHQVLGRMDEGCSAVQLKQWGGEHSSKCLLMITMAMYGMK